MHKAHHNQRIRLFPLHPLLPPLTCILLPKPTAATNAPHHTSHYVGYFKQADQQHPHPQHSFRTNCHHTLPYSPATNLTNSLTTNLSNLP